MFEIPDYNIRNDLSKVLKIDKNKLDFIYDLKSIESKDLGEFTQSLIEAMENNLKNL